MYTVYIPVEISIILPGCYIFPNLPRQTSQFRITYIRVDFFTQNCVTVSSRPNNVASCYFFPVWQSISVWWSALWHVFKPLKLRKEQLR